MKPHRMRMTHNLVMNYGMLEEMDVYVSVACGLVKVEYNSALFNGLIKEWNGFVGGNGGVG